MNRNSVQNNPGKEVSGSLTEEVTLSSERISDILMRVKPHLNKDLISDSNFDDILKVASFFPANISSFLGFECRLGLKEARADFLFAISKLGKDKYIFKEFLDNNHFNEHTTRKNEWERIATFIKAWTEPENTIYKNMRGFWMEFDMYREAPELPVPSIFFAPKKFLNKRDINNFNNYSWIVHHAFPVLNGASVPGTISGLFQKSIEEMPEGTNPFQIGYMLARPTKALRIHINKIKPEQIIPYLKKVGYQFDTEKLTSSIVGLEEIADRFVLSFDLTKDGIEPKIGIEFSFLRDRFEKENRWKSILEHLVNKRLCMPHKKEALLSYPGLESKESYGMELEPVISAANYSSEQKYYCVVRYISHIKLVYLPGEPLEAKAYLAVRLFKPVDNKV